MSLVSAHLASPSLRTKVSVFPKSPSAQPHRYASLADSDSERVAEAERGRTSDPQPGHHRTPSARCYPEPHSQAWLPIASGKEAICSRGLSTCVLMGRSHLLQRAAPSVPRSSSLIPQQEQIMEFVLDDILISFFTVFPLARVPLAL